VLQIHNIATVECHLAMRFGAERPARDVEVARGHPAPTPAAEPGQIQKQTNYHCNGVELLVPRLRRVEISRKNALEVDRCGTQALDS